MSACELIATCTSLFEFDRRRALLESKGIEVRSDTESTVAANPLYGPAVGELRIFVSHRDAERARIILHSLQPQPEADHDLRSRRTARKACWASVAIAVSAGVVSAWVHGAALMGVRVAVVLFVASYLVLFKALRE